MTLQTAVAAAETGLTLTAKLFTIAAPDTEVTGNTIAVTERTNAKGEYVASIDRATALPAGDYTLIFFDGTRPATIAKRTFAGVDGEVATVTKVNVELDSALTSQIATIAAVLGSAMRGERTHSQALDLILAATMGKSSQPSGTTEQFKYLDDADAFETTFDANGNRTAVSLL